MDYCEGQWQKVGTSKAVAGLPPPRLIKTSSARLDSCACSVQVCGLAGGMELPVWRHPASSWFFFKGNRQALVLSVPSLLGLSTVSTEKSSSLANGEVTKGLEGKADVDPPYGCMSSECRLNQRGHRDQFYPHKKILRSHHREKEKERENQ